MKIAVTGASGYLGRALLPTLSAEHEVFPSDLHPHDDSVIKADVLERQELERLITGMDSVVHLACAAADKHLSEAENDTQILDTRLKGSYNVMLAALEAGVSRVLQVSDLCVFSGYSREIVVSEDFVPLPDASATQQSIYLSELIGMEFGRQKPGLVLTLRLGQLVETKSLSNSAVFESDWLDLDDAVNAILRGLTLERYDRPTHWGIYNLASAHPGSRCCLNKIKSGRYGFTPKENFAGRQRVEVSA
jgi:nucleoside-diphosphate-sugar epimerase